jgi:4-carboxymuconolactone decarboxylase
VSRLEPLPPERLDDAQRALYEAITGGPRAQGTQHFALTDGAGRLNGPFDGFLRSPAIGEALQGVGAAVRYRSHLTPRVRESAILLVSAHWDSAFERHAHEAVGRSIGLTDDELSALRDGAVPASADHGERGRLEVVQALLRGDLTDAEWSRLAPAVGEQDVFELTALVGYYATLALQLRVFRVSADE